MEYRVGFRLSGKRYYTEWFETIEEADEFVLAVENSGSPRMYVTSFENSDD